MRKPVIAGNWKMNCNIAEAETLVSGLIPLAKDTKDREIVICPPFTALFAVSRLLNGTNIALGGQDLFFEEKGAFTGEISAKMLKDIECKYVIIGHSERRQYFHETDETVNKKIFAALKHDLSPIVCIGEALQQREKGETFKIIERQIKEGFKKLEIENWKLVIIAYEPIWAIGTGKTATPEQAEEVHAFIRKLLPKEVSNDIRILYGGSVKPDNIKDLMAKPDIDGALVGGASLDADSFSKIVKY
ncbi:MAG: triose-phosphate isomerase [Candidatus Saganbacteria bacterium]|nr:triose-phosphate isomerase [Candidatus Saganbacteria bacterium]